MSDRPLVSIIMPAHNREAYIGEAVESALSQDYENVELIVVDDGSTDRTYEILSDFGERIRLFRQHNAGPGAARNRGLDHAGGEFIAFLDSDDVWAPGKLRAQVSHLQRNPVQQGITLC